MLHCWVTLLFIPYMWSDFASSSSPSLFALSPLSRSQTSSESITSSSSKNIPAVLPKPLHEYNLEDCCDFLTSIQLEEYIPIFVQNKMDGIFMSCLAHEQIGLQLLNNLGITDHAHVITVIEARMKKNLSNSSWQATSCWVHIQCMVHGCGYKDW